MLVVMLVVMLDCALYAGNPKLESLSLLEQGHE